MAAGGDEGPEEEVRDEARWGALEATLPLQLNDGPAGEIRFRQRSVFAAAAVPDTVAARRLGGEQSNSSVLFDEYAVLKLYRRLHAGRQIASDVDSQQSFRVSHGGISV